jgi:hypothetical protein
MNPNHPEESRMAGKYVYASDIEWGEHEARENGLYAIHSGIEIEVYPELDDSGQPTRKWEWTVKPTSAVTEVPELFDLGVRPGKVSATWSAAKSLNKAIRHYVTRPEAERRARENAKLAAERKAKEAEATPEPKKTAAEMLEAVEAQVAEDMKAVRKRASKTAEKTAA